MKYSLVLSVLALGIQAACASDDGSPSNTESTSTGGSSAVGGARSNVAGSSSTGGVGAIVVVPGGLPDPQAATSLTQHSCYVGLKIPNVTYTGANCSASTTTTGVGAMGPKSWDDIRLRISMSLNNPPAIGKLDLASLTIKIPNGNDAYSWDAPVDACTATATDSSDDSFMGRIYYSIDISCSKPATPTTDPSLDPLPLGQFAIVTFFAVD